MEIRVSKVFSCFIALFIVSFLLMGNIDAATLSNEAASEVFAVKVSTLDSCSAYFEGTANITHCRDGEVPIPAATWLFILSLVAFVGFFNKRKL